MKLILCFLIFVVAHSIFQSYNFWVTRHSSGLSLFGIQFTSIWTFWLFALLVATPFLSIGNLMFSGTFYFGYREYDSAWIVLLSFIAAQTVAYPAMTYLWFGELPQKGALVGALLTLAGVVVATFWKD